MPRSIKTPLRPGTNFEDLDPRTQKALEERKLKRKSGSKKDPNDVIIKKEKPDTLRPFAKGRLAEFGIEKAKRQTEYKRAGFKSGSKGCKLAMRGKGRAYGKNS